MDFINLLKIENGGIGMVNKIEEFLNDKFGNVRATKDEKGLIWFVAKDISDALDYKLTTDMTRNLEDDEKGMQSLHTLGGKQELTVINESGLYSVILSITKRNKDRYVLSRDFKKWVTGEILPTIRTTGAYIESDREHEVVNNYFDGLSDELKLKVFEELKVNNEKLQVKANMWDKFLDTNNTYTFTEVAKLVSTYSLENHNYEFTISNHELTKKLRDLGILTKAVNKGQYINLPNKPYENYFNVVTYQNSGGVYKNTQTRVKSNGVEFIYDKLIKGNINEKLLRN